MLDTDGDCQSLPALMNSQEGNSGFDLSSVFKRHMDRLGGGKIRAARAIARFKRRKLFGLLRLIRTLVFRWLL